MASFPGSKTPTDIPMDVFRPDEELIAVLNFTQAGQFFLLAVVDLGQCLLHLRELFNQLSGGWEEGRRIAGWLLEERRAAGLSGGHIG